MQAFFLFFTEYAICKNLPGVVLSLIKEEGTSDLPRPRMENKMYSTTRNLTCQSCDLHQKQ